MDSPERFPLTHELDLPWTTRNPGPHVRRLPSDCRPGAGNTRQRPGNVPATTTAAESLGKPASAPQAHARNGTPGGRLAGAQGSAAMAREEETGQKAGLNADRGFSRNP
ncbi:hypothetical protein BLTE_05490 [Blastochloris tepida]|uniref:Uncharacterized protein n=1 Tax=Blastochloris tepida TaxID=2233851 RepID=A0A348FX31_9HYPH|nr:hypothetical protein BLTE_05490 [Blastochloris tepida]